MWPHGLYSPWNSPGQNTGVGSLSLLQGIFPIQGSNPGLLHCKCNLYQLKHKESRRTLEWVAYPFSSGSSQYRNWTRVSCIAGGIFTNWTMRETQNITPIPKEYKWYDSICGKNNCYIIQTDTISEGTHKNTIKNSYFWRMILQIFLLWAYNLCP